MEVNAGKRQGQCPNGYPGIFPINKRLMEIAGQPLDGEKSAPSDQEDVGRLIGRLATLSWIRSLCALVASGVAVASAM